MCAIAGLIGYRMDNTICKKMLDTMKRRGPDGHGIYFMEDGCLLHTRLAIIDPQGGKQPMALDWQNCHYVLSYNGELYNTEELRKDLLQCGHSFQTHSDTEVVLHAYAQWKEEALLRMNGIFAFAVWESASRTLFLARDRIGVKPLFFKHSDQSLIFASEIKTILAHPDVSAELDGQGIAQVLLLGPGRIPGSGVFRNIQELKPGSYAVFCDHKLDIRQYWKLRDREHNETFEDTAEYVRYLVQDSIKRQMVSDVSIGTFLSGGLDSSLITAICASQLQQDEKLMTFSVDYSKNQQYFQPGKFQPSADGEYINIMREVLRTDHHWTFLDSDQLLEALEDATEARDLPGMADVDFSLLLFCHEIRNHVKVALSGECADEIFGGYPWYRDPTIRDTDGFPWAQTTKQRINLLHPQIRDTIDGEDYIRTLYVDTLTNSDILPETSPLEKRMKQMVNLNFQWFMQTLLDRKDRMSMFHSLEVRVPFCDYRIAEYLYAVPWEYKDYNGMEKGLLRHAMRGILPDKVLYRKKSPYPKTYDPQYLSLVLQRFNDMMLEKDAPIFEITDRLSMQQLASADFCWPWYGQLMRRPQTLAYMLQINDWMKRYHIQVV